jgi:hypothetical protein
MAVNRDPVIFAAIFPYLAFPGVAATVGMSKRSR